MTQVALLSASLQQRDSPDEARMRQLVHDLDLPDEHPLRLRVQLRLVDQFHSHAVWKSERMEINMTPRLRELLPCFLTMKIHLHTEITFQVILHRRWDNAFGQVN